MPILPSNLYATELGGRGSRSQSADLAKVDQVRSYTISVFITGAVP